nr:hypothetical protein Iba_chr14cCG15650 [Ipomoea batatas]
MAIFPTLEMTPIMEIVIYVGSKLILCAKIMLEVLRHSPNLLILLKIKIRKNILGDCL